MLPEGYISTTEFGKRHGVCVETVNRWIHTSRLRGVIKVPHQNYYGFIYAVPEDAVPVPKDLLAFAPSGKDYRPEEMVEYIRKHSGTRTYGQISRELGIPMSECRRIYDHLHEAYGV